MCLNIPYLFIIYNAKTLPAACIGVKLGLSIEGEKTFEPPQRGSDSRVEKIA
jgi:hypothetical protein